MKLAKVIAIAMVLAMALIVSSVSAGNGIDLKGQHYNLNLIGMKNAKNMPANLDSGNVIFVAMGNGDKLQTRIYLAQGDNYQVLDKDGTDGNARFQLPKPYVGEDDIINPDACTSQYQIYVRVNGKPGGTGSMKTGACNTTDMIEGPEGYPICVQDGDYTWYHSEVVELSSHMNGGKFTQVTHELTTIEIDETHYGLFSERVPAEFGEMFYFWELMNDGMKLIQLRFYPTPEDYCLS
jgi:hypothetical protein